MKKITAIAALLLGLAGCSSPVEPLELRKISGWARSEEPSGEVRYLMFSGRPPELFVCPISAEDYARAEELAAAPYGCRWQLDNDPLGLGWLGIFDGLLEEDLGGGAW